MLIMSILIITTNMVLYSRLWELIHFRYIPELDYQNDRHSTQQHYRNYYSRYTASSQTTYEKLINTYFSTIIIAATPPPPKPPMKS